MGMHTRMIADIIKNIFWLAATILIIKSITTQSVLRETGKELWNGIKDEIVSKGVQEVIDEIQNFTTN